MTKGIMLISGLCFLLYTALFAQPFKAGVFAGIAASQVDGDTYAGYRKAGFLPEDLLPKNSCLRANGVPLLRSLTLKKGAGKRLILIKGTMPIIN